ncbi:MAG: hypothetical protein JWO02_3299 [Solirubrobacterales bacterium]|nr:hypothetical protein [Solirubrobacterales bacterium]
MGAGPFFEIGAGGFDETRYLGEACVLTHTTMLGQWGPIAVELQQFHDVSPPELAAALRPAGSRVSHVGYTVPDAPGESARLTAAGMPLFLHARQGELEVRFHRAVPMGHAIEIFQAGEQVDGLFAFVAHAAREWDGRDPIRSLPSP